MPVESREYYKCYLHVSGRTYGKQAEPDLQSIPEERNRQRRTRHRRKHQDASKCGTQTRSFSEKKSSSLLVQKHCMKIYLKSSNTLPSNKKFKPRLSNILYLLYQQWCSWDKLATKFIPSPTHPPNTYSYWSRNVLRKRKKMVVNNEHHSKKRKMF